MRDFTYKTHGTCSREILFSLDDENRIHNLSFIGGCNGNLKGIGRLLKGRDVKEVMEDLEGVTCGIKSTSCPDQISKALQTYIKENG